MKKIKGRLFVLIILGLFLFVTTGCSNNNKVADNQDNKNTTESQEGDVAKTSNKVAEEKDKKDTNETKKVKTVEFKEASWLGLDEDFWGRVGGEIYCLEDGKKEGHIKLVFDVNEAIKINRVVFSTESSNKKFNWSWTNNTISSDKTVFKVANNVLSLSADELYEVLDPSEKGEKVTELKKGKGYEFNYYLDLDKTGFRNELKSAKTMNITFNVTNSLGKEENISTSVKLNK
ncbi:hypothetical protein [Clostridium sp. 'White wine YQ']|uniref:hypothetical protein n=1 Tax=Clostridium sp. 'White wine YQ' TaxID=3027474 RepID=UPI0023672E46|nr:hypothetical protein [Clostridium sp. 'White wine YQ']MDD7794118.1 hypothetical protein [Clostridium sp. 'White wine YQ']